MSNENGDGNAAQGYGKGRGAFQNEVYGAGVRYGIRPSVTMDPNKLEEQAKSAMSATSYAYVAGGAGERATMDANRQAFRQWKLVPRMLQPTTQRDLAVTLFGKRYSSPVLVSPVGVQTIFHGDGETGMAEVAAGIDVPYVASTASDSTMEEIAEASGTGARWYQLYWPQTERLTESLLERAKKSGYEALVVTLDTWTLAWRPSDLDLAYVPFFKGTGNRMGFSDPVFREMFAARAGGKTPEEDPVAASMTWIGDVFSGKHHSWEDLAHVRKHWDGPLLLKGIQHPGDAVKAIEHGADGIIVSNHGGRQMDGAVGSLEMLPECVEAVANLKTGKGERPTVLFDSGIRTGVDIIKALCLGAQAVLVGRPWVYGFGINGKEGARDVLRGLLADLDQSMGLAGIKSIDDCDRKWLRRSEYGSERFSSN